MWLTFRRSPISPQTVVKLYGGLDWRTSVRQAADSQAPSLPMVCRLARPLAHSTGSGPSPIQIAARCVPALHRRKGYFDLGERTLLGFHRHLRTGPVCSKIRGATLQNGPSGYFERGMRLRNYGGLRLPSITLLPLGS